MMAGWVESWLIFAGVMALGQFSPGPDMLLLTRVALASGRAAGCITALGVVCGLGLHALVAVTGVALVLNWGGLLATVLPWLAALYLVYLAVPLIRSGLRAKVLVVAGQEDARLKRGWWVCWKRGFLCNLLNPKVAVFLAGVTAPFLAIPEAPTGWPLMLWLTIVLEGGVLWCCWAALLQWPVLKNRYLRAAHWFDLGFGVALLAIAVLLVL